MIKLGCCIATSDFDEFCHRALLLKETGFDYIELQLSDLVSAEEAYRKKILTYLNDLNFPCLAMNLFIPGELKLIGTEVDLDRVRRYFEKAFPVAKSFGAETIVFGSGKARILPQSFSYDTAITQIIAFLRLANGYCEDYGIDIAIEPLNSSECNIINSVSEGYWIAKYVDRSHIKLLADYYHMQMDGESTDAILKAKNMLVHTHIASKSKRYYPMHETQPEHELFWGALKQIGYDACVSIEGHSDNFDIDIKSAFAVLSALRG